MPALVPAPGGAAVVRADGKKVGRRPVDTSRDVLRFTPRLRESTLRASRIMAAGCSDTAAERRLGVSSAAIRSGLPRRSNDHRCQRQPSPRRQTRYAVSRLVAFSALTGGIPHATAPSDGPRGPHLLRFLFSPFPPCPPCGPSFRRRRSARPTRRRISPGCRRGGAQITEVEGPVVVAVSPVSCSPGPALAPERRRHQRSPGERARPARPRRKTAWPRVLVAVKRPAYPP